MQFRKLLLERWTTKRLILLKKLHFAKVVAESVPLKSFTEVARSKSYLIHIISLFVAVVVSFSVIEKERELTLFDFHAMLMTVGTQVLFAEGIIIRQDGLIVKALADIMSGTMRHKER